MEIRTFWLIILKGVGLWLLINCLYIFPQIAGIFLTSQFITGWNASIPELILGIAALLFYFIISWLFLFNTEKIIYKLKLENHFTESKIDISVSANTVLKIIVILIGGITFINSFPNLVRELFEFIQQKNQLREYPNLTWLLFHFINTLIGYLLMTNSNSIVKLINSQHDKNSR